MRVIRIKTAFSRTEILFIIYFLYTLGDFGSRMLNWPAMYVQIPLYFFFLMSIVCVLGDKSYLPVDFLKWFVPFILLGFISIIYSTSFSDSTQIIPTISMAFLLGFAISIMLKIPGSISWIKYSHIIVSIPIGIYLVRTFQQAHWWSRLGEAFGMNENAVGLYFLVPFIFAITEISRKNRIIINICSIAVCLYVMLLSGSKKALLGLIIFVIVYLYFKSKGMGKKVLIIVASIAGVYALMWAVYSVPLLYNIIGYRMQLFLSTFLNGSAITGSGSTSERLDMISYGLRLFAKSPLFGNGINTFQYYYGTATGFYAYAHNNYIEILSTLGLLGFCLYYARHYKMIKGLIVNRGRNEKFAEGLALIILILFYDIGMVTYHSTRIILLISLASFIVETIKAEARISDTSM